MFGDKSVLMFGHASSGKKGGEIPKTVKSMYSRLYSTVTLGMT